MFKDWTVCFLYLLLLFFNIHYFSNRKNARERVIKCIWNSYKFQKLMYKIFRASHAVVAHVKEKKVCLFQLSEGFYWGLFRVKLRWSPNFMFSILKLVSWTLRSWDDLIPKLVWFDDYAKPLIRTSIHHIINFKSQNRWMLNFN